jgi:hypothetical protein
MSVSATIVEILRLISAAFFVLLSAALIVSHTHGAMKGFPVPIPAVVMTILLGIATSFICVLRWNAFAAPFAAGVAAGIFGLVYAPNSSPYCAALGLLVGGSIACFPWPFKRVIVESATEEPVS